MPENHPALPDIARDPQQPSNHRDVHIQQPVPVHQPVPVVQYPQQQFQVPLGAYPYYLPQNYVVPTVTMPPRNSGSAPTFDSTNPRDLLRYFAEVELLLNAANIHDDQIKKEHTKRYLSTRDFEIWDSLPETYPRYSYPAFKEAVVTLYPGAEADRKYTRADVSRLTESRRTLGIASTIELGEYYREFQTITAYLIERRKMSEMEARREFVTGFPRELLVRVAHRLQVTFPEADPDDGYPISEVYRAALFCLRGSSFFPQDMYSIETSSTAKPLASSPAPSVPRASSSPVIAETTSVQPEDRLYAALDRFAQTIANSVSASVHGSQPPAVAQTLSLQVPQSAPSPSPSLLPTRAFIGENDRCNFCGESGHFIANCPTVDQYLREGKVLRRPDGRLCLPNGHFVPRSIEGQWLKDRLDEWWRRQLGSAIERPSASSTSQNPATSMFYSLDQVPTSCSTPRTSTSPVTTVSQQRDEEDVNLKIWTLQQELYALQARRKKTRQVEPLRRPTGAFREDASSIAKQSDMQPTRSETCPVKTVPCLRDDCSTQSSAENQPSPSITAPQLSASTRQPASVPMPLPTLSTTSAKPLVHSYEKANGTLYVPPVHRYSGAAPKRTDKDSSSRIITPIHDPKLVDTVLDRSLKDTCVTLSLEELLSLSPDLRHHVKDRVTVRRLLAAETTRDPPDAELDVVEEVMSQAVMENRKGASAKVSPRGYQLPDIVQAFYSAPDPSQKIVLRSPKASSHAFTIPPSSLPSSILVHASDDPRTCFYWTLAPACDRIPIPSLPFDDNLTMKTRYTLAPFIYSLYISSTHSRQHLIESSNAPAKSPIPASSISTDMEQSPSSTNVASPTILAIEKHYKSVSQPIQPVLDALSEKFQVVYNVAANTLARVPKLYSRPADGLKKIQQRLEPATVLTRMTRHCPRCQPFYLAIVIVLSLLFFVQPWCSLLSYPKYRLCRNETSLAIGNVTDTKILIYSSIPRSESTVCEEARPETVLKYLDDWKHSTAMADRAFDSFPHLVHPFVIRVSRFWWNDPPRMPQPAMIKQPRRLEVQREYRDSLRHEGCYRRRPPILERFSRRHISNDIKYIQAQTCHLHQERWPSLVPVPSIVAQPAPLATRVDVNVLQLPLMNRSQFIVKTWCSLSHHLKHLALRRQTQSRCTNLAGRRRTSDSPSPIDISPHPLLPLDIVDLSYPSSPPEAFLLPATDSLPCHRVELRKHREWIESLREFCMALFSSRTEFVAPREALDTKCLEWIRQPSSLIDDDTCPIRLDDEDNEDSRSSEDGEGRSPLDDG